MGGERRVVIVGSGPGGAVTAHVLAAAGVSCVLLEAGPRFSPLRDYPMGRNTFETDDPFTGDPIRDRITGDVPKVQRVKGWGGTSLHYEAQLLRPTGHDDLMPYFERVEEALGATTHVLSPASEAIRAGAAKIGMTIRPQLVGVLTSPRADRGACARCGGCVKGCMTGAKGSMDVTFLRAAERTGKLDARIGWRVRRVELDGKGAFSRAIARTPQGIDEAVDGTVCVLAAGAIETPRLLLLSDVGTKDGFVGRGYMETNVFACTGLLPASVRSWEGLTVDNVLADFLTSDERRGYRGAITGSASAGAAGFLGPLKHALRMVGGFGARHLSEMKRTLGGAVSFIMSGEPTKQANNLVDLDPLVKDDLGDPVPRIQYGPSDNDHMMLKHMKTVAHDILGAAGAERIEDIASSERKLVGAEPRGTMGMCTDEHGRVNGVPGLFVADASLFRSGLVPANPSLAIMAMAWRNAELLVKEAGR